MFLFPDWSCFGPVVNDLQAVPKMPKNIGMFHLIFEASLKVIHNKEMSGATTFYWSMMLSIWTLSAFIIIQAQFCIIPNIWQTVLTYLTYLSLYLDFSLFMQHMGVDYIFDLMKPHEMKCTAVKSQGCIGQAFGPPLPVWLLGHTLFK